MMCCILPAFRVTAAELPVIRRLGIGRFRRLCKLSSISTVLSGKNPPILWPLHCLVAGNAAEENGYKNTAAHFHEWLYAPLIRYFLRPDAPICFIASIAIRLRGPTDYYGSGRLFALTTIPLVDLFAAARTVSLRRIRVKCALKIGGIPNAALDID